MVSDSGRYPEGMQPGATINYDNSAEAVSIIKSSLDDYEQTHLIAAQGYNMIRSVYSKARQWSEFRKASGRTMIRRILALLELLSWHSGPAKTMA